MWVALALGFGALLIYTAVRVPRHGGTQVHPGQNPVLRLIRRVVPATDELHGHKFFTCDGGRWLATPLLAVLILIESTDVYQIPTWASLLFILIVLAGTFGLSWRATRGRQATLGTEVTRTGAGRSGCGS